MISSSDIAASARFTLRDNFATIAPTFTDPELVDAINRALKFCGSMVASMSTKLETLPLVAGSVQKLPYATAHLAAVFSNANPPAEAELVGVRQCSGDAPVQQVTLEYMHTLLRAAGSTTKKLVTMYAMMAGTMHAFVVYPPNDGTGKLLVSYRAELPKISALGDNDIDVSNLFEGALTSYVLFALLTRDGNDSPLAADGKSYLELCSAQIAALQPPAPAA